MSIILDPDPAAGGSIAGLVEIDVTVQRVAPVNGAVYVVDGADVYVERADGTAIAVWTTQAGNVAAAKPLKSSNGRVYGWVEGGLLLRYRAVHPSLDPNAPWEYFVSGGGPAGPTGPAGATGPAGPAGGLLAPGAHASAARAFATTYQPSATRPVLVVASVNITCAAATGRINVLCAAANPPAVKIGEVILRNQSTSEVIKGEPVTFLVPAGFYYRLATDILGGAPTFGLASVFEQAL